MSQPTAITVEDLASRHWTIEEARSYCDQMAKGLYNRFPLGPLLIPGKLRPHIHAIYAFAHVADDYTNQPAYDDALRIPLLENWEVQLMQSMWRRPQHPVCQ